MPGVANCFASPVSENHGAKLWLPIYTRSNNTWELEPFPLADNWWITVHWPILGECTSSTFCVMVTSQLVAFVYNGKKWSRKRMYLPSAVASNATHSSYVEITGLSCAGPTTCFMIGKVYIFPADKNVAYTWGRIVLRFDGTRFVPFHLHTEQDPGGLEFIPAGFEKIVRRTSREFLVNGFQWQTDQPQMWAIRYG